MKYSLYVLFGKSIENATPSQSIQSSRVNATPSSGTSPLASKEVPPPPHPLPLWELPTMFCQTLRLHYLPKGDNRFTFVTDFTLDFTETLLLRESEKKLAVFY